MAYNPYDLVDLLVNGKKIHGRPIAFDSDVTNHKTMENAFGNYVKPTKLSSCCPDCGQGLEFEVVLDDPPFNTVIVVCYHCKPAAPPSVNPFMNPLDDGRIPSHDLDPLLHNPNEHVVNDDDDESSVADRIQFDMEEDMADMRDSEAWVDKDEYVIAADPPSIAERIHEEIIGDPAITGNIDARSLVTVEVESEIEVEVEVEVEVTAEATAEVTTVETTIEPPETSEIKEESKEIPPEINEAGTDDDSDLLNYKMAESDKAKKKRPSRSKKPKIAIEPVDGLTAEIELDDDLAEQE